MNYIAFLQRYLEWEKGHDVIQTFLKLLKLFLNSKTLYFVRAIDTVLYMLYITLKYIRYIYIALENIDNY